jgi:hypothetical protein
VPDISHDSVTKLGAKKPTYVETTQTKLTYGPVVFLNLFDDGRKTLILIGDEYRNEVTDPMDE